MKRKPSREESLKEFAATHPEVDARAVATDLSTEDGIGTVARTCADEPLDMLVNNAGVAHYMPPADLPEGKAGELVNVKVVAPTQLMRAAVGPRQRRGTGTILDVAGMITFSGRLLQNVFAAGLAAFGGRSPQLATRYTG